MSASSNPLPPLNKICLIQWAFLIDTVIKWAFLLVACPLPFELDSSYLIGCFKQNLGGGGTGVTTEITRCYNRGHPPGHPGGHHGGHPWGDPGDSPQGESPRGGGGGTWDSTGSSRDHPRGHPGGSQRGGKPPWGGHRGQYWVLRRSP